MDETTYLFLGYLFILLCLVWYYRKWIYRNANSTQKEDRPKKRTDVLVPGVDYIEEFGVIDLNKEEIMHSDFFFILLKKVPALEEDIESSRLFYDIVKRLQPYSMTDLYKVVEHLRTHPEDSPEVHRAYKTHITASAILYDFIIPKALFNDDTVVLTYVAAHMRMQSPVNVFDVVQDYIRQEHPGKEGEEIVEEHREIERLLNDMAFANIFLSMVFDHEAYLSIEYLYGRWLEQPSVNAFNKAFYKQDIGNFKKLVTMYFGVMEIDVPKDYLFVNTAISEYILQIRRYDPKVNKIKVVE